MITCPICNKEFKPKNSLQKFCSAECRKKELTKRASLKVSQKRMSKFEETKHRICPVCEKEFEAVYGTYGYRQKYCSSQCRRKAERMYGCKAKTDLSYKNKIRFSGNKYKVLERDNNECQICGSKKNLIIHHKDCSGQSDNPNNDIDNLVTLCRKCHMNIHKVI